jgi:ABC-type branched-subunit amino acid transport system ATPase component
VTPTWTLSTRGPPVSDTPLLALDHVTARGDWGDAIHGVSLAIDGGESLGLCGANGSGKAAVLDLISGFVQAREGIVRLDGRAITGWAPHRIARAGIARTFRIPRVSARLTVGETIAASLLYRRSPPRAARYIADRVLDIVGLSPLRGHETWMLTPGQIRRVELGRALAMHPRVMLIDDPLASLGAEEIPETLTVLRRLRADGRSMLVVTQSRALLDMVCDRVALIHHGRIARTVTPADLPDA